jgi:synaptobrevin family protein YKT6
MTIYTLKYVRMRIVGIYVIDIDQKTCKFRGRLDFINFMKRNTVKELLKEFALAAAESLGSPERKIFEHDQFQFICHRADAKVVIMVIDNEYPSRVAFKIINDIFGDESEEFINYILQNRQDGLDRLGRLRSEIDETMVIAHENINRVIARGDDIDELVERSKNLSANSKLFYKAAAKHNRCCYIS